ncbi:hypothetical protein Droror1_Dr00008173 [Drosera rotundifolia]
MSCWKDKKPLKRPYGASPPHNPRKNITLTVTLCVVLGGLIPLVGHQKSTSALYLDPILFHCFFPRCLPENGKMQILFRSCKHEPGCWYRGSRRRWRVSS